MRAEITIAHNGTDVLPLLERLYGPNDLAALRSSALWRKAPVAAQSIDYAASKIGLVVMASFVGRSLELYIESSGGQLRAGAARVWAAIRDNASEMKPKLMRLVLFDEDANDVIVEAGVGVGGRLRRQDLFVPIATGAASMLVVVLVRIFAQASPDFYYGSATAVAVAILSLARLVLPLSEKELVWR